MVKRLVFRFWLHCKGIFGTKIEGTDSSESNTGVPITIFQTQQERLLAFFNQNRNDVIDYTNTVHHFQNNYGHLDDVNDPEFDNVTEQVGLVYDKDGKTPLNAAEMFDMTYEQYREYKKKILPHAKSRKITMEEIDELFN